MSQYIKPFLDYLAASPTAFHAVDGAQRALLDAGFVRLNEHEAFSVRPGGQYFVTRNQSSLIAFRVPERGLAPFRITASHVDSPAFKLKTRMEDRSVKPYTRLNAEKYGGAILSTWLDRPLSVAGRLLVRTDRGLESRLCDLGRDAAVIPNLPIHFNRAVNDGYAFNVQKDMMALWGEDADENALLAELAAGVKAKLEDVAGHDLYLYSRMPATNLPYREVLPGSITATIGIMVASIAYLIYIRYFFRLDAIFGALTSIIVLILWFFMMSFMLVFGIIVNVAFRDTRAEK